MKKEELKNTVGGTVADKAKTVSKKETLKKEKAEVKSKKIKIKSKPVIINKDKMIERDGYRLYFVDKNDENTMNELRNSGKSMGEISVVSSTNNDNVDEVIIVVKN